MAESDPSPSASPSNVIEVHPLSTKPDLAWEKLSVSQTVQAVTPISPETPKPDGHTRFVCISDTHNKTDRMKPLPEGDVLIHAGDFSSMGYMGEVRKFNTWLGEQMHPHKIVIAGNHEVTFDFELMRRRASPLLHWTLLSMVSLDDVKDIKTILTNCTYLEDQEVTVLGHRIYGSPWQPMFYQWGFNVDRGEKLLKIWNKIPEGIDVLVTHGPPIGRGDETNYGQRAGCVELLSTVQQRVKPKYHVFGHIHEAYGVTTDGNTTFINASTVNGEYQPDNPPVIFDLPNNPQVDYESSI